MITTTVHITIVRAAAAGQPVPEAPSGMPPDRAFWLVESPTAVPPTFNLNARIGSSAWRAHVSAAESAQLAALLDALPARDLSAPPHSFDGQQIVLMLLKNETPLIFSWQNEDWQFDTHNRAAWTHVQAAADTILKLADTHQPL
ncbi:MAG: hypothetical protein KC425_18310 [Anaerolineales bacterium]|nr:hypothetical protein [Anaerolineales bacterium]